MSISKFSLYWDAENSDKYTGVPTLFRTRNDLDAHGTLLGVNRLPAEENIFYYKRLQSVLPLRGGAEHDGLVHGITRELGLEEGIGIKISPVSSGGRWLAPAPYVKITATNLILYSSYTDSSTYTLDRSIDIFGHGGGYLLEDLVNQIQSSDYFVAELGSGMTGVEKSNGLFPGSSATVVSKEWVPANTFFTLENLDIIPSTLYFSEKEIFTTELSNALANTQSSGLSLTWVVSDEVTKDGEYHVDYSTGVVTVKQSSSGRGTCRYVYRNFPWYVRWSPIVVYSLRDNNYRSKVFEDEFMTDNSTKDGLTTAEGVEVYTQVFNKSPCLWGK